MPITTTINNIAKVEIETEMYFDKHNLRTMCISRDYYTKGTNDQYCDLMEMVEQMEVNYENAFQIAKNIADHSVKPSWQSDDEMLSGVLYDVLNNTVVFVPIVSTETEIESENENLF